VSSSADIPATVLLISDRGWRLIDEYIDSAPKAVSRATVPSEVKRAEHEDLFSSAVFRIGSLIVQRSVCEG